VHEVQGIYNECVGVSPPDMQLREDHAAGSGSDCTRLRG
jgi:hypothetical protein